MQAEGSGLIKDVRGNNAGNGMRVHIEIWTRQLASVVELLDASTASTERYFNYKLAAFDVFFF